MCVNIKEIRNSFLSCRSLVHFFSRRSFCKNKGFYYSRSLSEQVFYLYGPPGLLQCSKSRRNSRVLELLFLDGVKPYQLFFTDVGLKVPLVFLMVAVRLVFSVPAAINTNWKSQPWLMKNSLEENKRFLGVHQLAWEEMI